MKFKLLLRTGLLPWVLKNVRWVTRKIWHLWAAS